MSDTPREAYTGYEELASYLRNYRKKSYWGFLRRHREIIVTSTMPSFATSRCDPDKIWYQHFLAEAKAQLNQNDFDILDKKVCFFILQREGNS